jgi:hypothetical protein
MIRVKVCNKCWKTMSTNINKPLPPGDYEAALAVVYWVCNSCKAEPAKGGVTSNDIRTS